MSMSLAPTHSRPDSSIGLPLPAVTSTGKGLAALLESKSEVVALIGGRSEDAAVVRRTTEGGYEVKTPRVTAVFDSSGVCTGFRNAQGDQMSSRNLGGNLLLEKIERWGLVEDKRHQGESQVALTGSEALTPAIMRPQSTPWILAVGSDTPFLRQKGVSSSAITAFMKEAETIFARHGHSLTREQVVALTATCLQENALSTGRTAGGLGICQWNGSRETNYHLFARQYARLHPGTSTVGTQLAYVLHEMGEDVGPRGAGKGVRSEAGEMFLKATSVEEAMNALAKYEGYGNAGNRYRFARELDRGLRRPNVDDLVI